MISTKQVGILALIDYKNCQLNKFGVEHLAQEEAIKRGLKE